MATALSVITNACQFMGLVAPTTAYGNTNQQVIHLCGLANQEGIDLAHAHQWQRITVATTYTTLAQQEQTNFFASDFDRFCNDSMWNTTTARKAYGPMTEQEWQQYQAFPIFTTMNPAFIVRNTSLYLQPAPAAGQTLSYSYVSKNWAQTSGGTGIDAFTADTDVPRLDPTLMSLGIVWRFRKAKGFDYSEEYRTYQDQKAQYVSRDGGAPKLNLAYGLNRFSPYPYNVPEGSWP